MDDEKIQAQIEELKRQVEKKLLDAFFNADIKQDFNKHSKFLDDLQKKFLKKHYDIDCE
jgi:hypothetical protein